MPKTMLSLLLFVSLHAVAMDPELLNMVGKYRLSGGDAGCATVAHVEKARAEETLTIKDTTRGSDLSIFPDVNKGKITYHEDFRVLKQRNTIYERGLLVKQLRQCRSLIMQTCYPWKTVASFKILSRQSFELLNNGKLCSYEAL